MRHASLLFAATVLSLTTQYAAAAPATPAEADRIRSSIETYIGNGGGSGVSPVSVTASGESYAVSIDIAQLVRPLAALGFSLQAAPVSMTLTPQADGMWRVLQTAMPEMQIRIKDQDMKFRIDGYAFDGLYDPKMMAFVIAKSGQSASILESSTPQLLNTRRDGPTRAEITGTSSGPGIVSAIMRGQTDSHSQTFKIMAGANPLEFGMTMGPISTDVTLDSFRNLAAMDLWAFLVANASEAALKAKAEDIKVKVRAAFPIFALMSQSSKIQALAVTTPVGTFGMKEAAVGLRVTGVQRDGDAGIKLGLNGITVPDLPMLPPWARDLLPSDFLLDLQARGYDLQEAFEIGLNAIREGSTPSESEAAGRRAVFALAPPGKVKITMGPSQIVSKLLAINMEGEMTIIQPIPRGRLVMKARGIDQTIAALQAAAATDRSVQQALMFLIGAKGFGKAEPDGSLSWLIENPDGGIPTINGVSIPGMGR
jgi:hypothetical protein